MKEHFKYTAGDQILDLTFDPPLPGVIVRSHEKPDTYYVRLEESINEVVIHARNLRMN